jgi:hypothetical protein
MDMPNFISMEVNGTIIRHDPDALSITVNPIMNTIELNLDDYKVNISTFTGLVFIYHRCKP